MSIESVLDAASRLARLVHGLPERLYRRQKMYGGIDLEKPYDGDTKRFQTDDPERAQVISSELRLRTRPDDTYPGAPAGGYHMVAVDLDVPAWLVPSTTPGHSHLYIDKVLPWDQYKELLAALVNAGLIERGYYQASVERGGTHLRLPWIKKTPTERARSESLYRRRDAL